MVSLNSILMTTVIVFGAFDNYIIYASSGKEIPQEGLDASEKKPENYKSGDSIAKALWDDAVNSKKLLNAALRSDSTRIEADVILGNLNGKEALIPIMGNPPAKTSDLSLREFLDILCKYSKKKVKLDFKSADAFKAAIPIMKESFKEFGRLNQPWLHADILPGPGSEGNTTVDKYIFFDMSEEYFPASKLSLGWTTVLNKIQTKYTKDNVADMLNELQVRAYSKTVTFSVRALFAINSTVELQDLLNKWTGLSTLTIWCRDEEEKVEFNKIQAFVTEIGKWKAWLDLPPICYDKIK